MDSIINNIYLTKIIYYNKLYIMINNKEQLVKIIDFWNKGAKSGDLFDRALVSRLDLKSKEIVDLVGPRRSGKSSILKLVIKKLKLDDNFLYINFEDPFFIANNSARVIEDLVEVFLEYFSKDLRYIFFDEIQEISGWEKTLRKFRDGKDYKIFITGSSSKLLSSEIASLLTGRHLSYNVFPLSFSEFLAFKGVSALSKKDRILNEPSIIKSFDEFLLIGGFPEAVLTGAKELLKNYFYDILQKDVAARHNIRAKGALEKMGVYLLSNSGKTISLESLKKTLNLSYVSANGYLNHLQDAFLVFAVPQFSYSLKKQAKAFKKIYAIDTGLADAVSFKFSEDKGRLLENAVALELLKSGNSIFYYHGQGNSEADFVVKDKLKVQQVIQVCWSLNEEKTRKREISGLVAALREFKLPRGLILTYAEEEIIETEQGKIFVKPAAKWILEQAERREVIIGLSLRAPYSGRSNLTDNYQRYARKILLCLYQYK